MQVKIIALTMKAEEALRKYIDDSKNLEDSMLKLSRINPKRVKFETEQRLAKRFVTEEFFENPLMIVASVNSKYNSRAYAFIPQLEQEFHKIMLNSNCGKEDYKLEVI